MSKDVFDLMVRVKNHLREMENKLPNDKLAYFCGVLTGLNFGEVSISMEATLIPPGILDVISDTTRSIPELLYAANYYMAPEKRFTGSLFTLVGYRSGSSANDYNDGIRLGYEYVVALREATSTQNDAIEHLRKVRKFMMSCEIL